MEEGKGVKPMGTKPRHLMVGKRIPTQNCVGTAGGVRTLQ